MLRKRLVLLQKRGYLDAAAPTLTTASLLCACAAPTLTATLPSHPTATLISSPTAVGRPTSPSTNTVAGREGIDFIIDTMGLRVPAALLPHQSWTLEIAFGDFGPNSLESVFGAILETLHLKTMESDGTLTCVDVQEVSMKVCFPEGYATSRKDEQNRRGSFVSFNLRPPDGCQTPCLAEIQFFSEESIREFTADCEENTDSPCFFGDYPDLERYLGQREALIHLAHYRDYELRKFNGRHFLATNRQCYGDTCVYREYTTFVGDIKLDVWIVMTDVSQTGESDQLLTQLIIRNSSDWK